MTQGVIVYLLGRGEPPQGIEAGSHYQGLSRLRGPGEVEVVVSQPGILELDDAWHFLSSLGCDPIHVLVTRAEPDRLRPLYPLVRLSGVARGAAGPSPAGLPGRVLH
jgi:hypothetical protein